MLVSKEYFIPGKNRRTTELYYVIGFYGATFVSELDKWFNSVDFTEEEKEKRSNLCGFAIGKTLTDKLIQYEEGSLEELYELSGEVLKRLGGFINCPQYMKQREEDNLIGIEDLEFYVGEILRTIECAIMVHEDMESEVDVIPEDESLESIIGGLFGLKK